MPTDTAENTRSQKRLKPPRKDEEPQSEFVTVEDFLRDLPPEPNWIVDKLLYPGTELHFFGHEGIGKTRCIYQLAYALQTGGSWMGFSVVQTGPVLLLELDMAPDELGEMLTDAQDAGMVGGKIIVPKTRNVLDVLTTDGHHTLQTLNKQYKPLSVIVDTCNDAFEAGTTTNEVVKAVFRAFRSAFPQAACVYLNHERKRSQESQSRGVTDEEAYLGPGQWSRSARSAVQLIGINDTDAKLKVHKSRTKAAFKELKLKRNDYGFFDPVYSNTLALDVFPYCLPDPSVAEYCRSIQDVCRCIADEFGFKSDTVYQAYKRGKKRGVKYRWMSLLEDGAEHA